MSENIRIEWIDNLIYSDTVRKKYDGKAVLNTASKISLFSLVNYDKLCYIDDMIQFNSENETREIIVEMLDYFKP